MERKRPVFFVQNPDNSWRSQNFSLIEGSGKITELANLVMGIEQKAIIREFIDDHFGETLDFERQTPNPAGLAPKFESFKDNQLVDAEDVERVLIEALTFEDLVQFSQYCHIVSKKIAGNIDVGSEEVEFVFKDARYWQDVHNTIREAYEINKANNQVPSNVIRIDWSKKSDKDHQDPSEPSA